MLISYRWLGRHVDLEGIAPDQLANDLTLSTCEVEGITEFAPHMSDVVVGHVVTRTDHPDADKLSICSVDVGSGDPLQIVCGAPNVAAGQKVCVATVGTVLPGDFKIKKSKIRGQQSMGMICSVRELEMGDEHDGIWVLPDECAVGDCVSASLDLDDWVIEVDNKSLTHRPDLWGHRGVAQEVAAIYGRSLKPLDLSMPEVGTAAALPVTIESVECSRYMGLAIDGVSSDATPAWMRQLLLAVGQRPIDRMVDLSNFVMLDLGQPNHVFDRGTFANGGIVVRTAGADSTLETLDGEQRSLVPSDLLICAGDTPVALAGVMGGGDSKVQPGCSQFFLEVATFQPAGVRRTSARLGLRTDSSARFEKHLDPTLPAQGMAHFVRLLMDMDPGVSLPMAMSDSGEWSDPACSIELDTNQVRTSLGVDLTDDEILSILERLELHAERSPSAAGQSVSIRVPSARATKDLRIAQDLVEEVGRIHRYGRVPEAALVAEVRPAPVDERRRLVRRMQDRLAGGAQMNEVISYSFQDDELLMQVGLADADYVEVINPARAGLSKVRRCVLPSLLGLLAEARRQSEDVRIFEVGKAYLPGAEGAAPTELHQLALAWSAPAIGDGAAFDAPRMLHLQGVLTDLADHLGLPRLVWALDEDPASWAHPDRCLVALLPDSLLPEGQGTPQIVGRLCDLNPAVAGRLGLAGELASDSAVALLDLDAVLGTPAAPLDYHPIPRFPGVKVDVAVLSPESVQAGQILELLEKSAKGLLHSAELFDLYRGESLGAERKSLAYHLLLQANNRTLTDKDCAKFLDRLERQLESLGCELRRS